jgi:dissimilatory sulfite reductase (desulfoviridin) alpha/beta subunit
MGAVALLRHRALQILKSKCRKSMTCVGQVELHQGHQPQNRIAALQAGAAVQQNQ